MNSKIYNAAALASSKMGLGSAPVEDIVKCVKLHAGIAVGAAWIPIGGLDLAALTGNVWTMYVRINKLLGIPFSENMMKSIGSAVMANLASNLAMTGFAAAIKWIPGIGTITGGALMSAAVFATTVGAAWVYLMAISNWANGGSGSVASLKLCVEDIMANNKSEINDIINCEKANYRA